MEDARAHQGRQGRDARLQCRDHRCRPAQPPAPARHQGRRDLQGQVVPLRASGITRSISRASASRSIGTGASAFQFVPEIAPDVAQLYVFQRTAPWLGPTPNYHDKVDDGKKWLLEARALLRQVVPLLAVLDADRRHLRIRQGRSELEQRARTRSAQQNDMLRQMLTDYTRGQLEGRPELQDAADAELSAGRQALACATTACGSRALKRPNVETGHRSDRRDHADRPQDRRAAGRSTSTSSSTAPASPRASSSSR